MENKSFPSANFRQGMELLRILELALNKANPSAEQVDSLIKNPSQIYEMVSKLFAKKFDDNKNSRQIKLTWQKIYQEWFGLQKDFSGIQAPNNYDPRKHFAVIVAQGLTMNEVVVAMRKRFKVCLYTDNLDTAVNKNDRTAEDGDYIVLFNKNVEADEEFKNLSANQLDKSGHKGTTLMERLILEVLYFDKTKKHLDINNWTLCNGSRYSDGCTPYVYWYSGIGKLDVDWGDSDFACDYLCSRAVVS